MQLTTVQQLIVASPHPRILVLAVPGAGKTRVLIERIRRLIADGVDPLRLVAITFTNAAAKEILARLGKDASGRPIKLGFAGTLHAFMTRIIHLFSAITFSVIDEEQANEILQEVIAEMRYTGTQEELQSVLAAGPVRVKKQFPSAAENTASRFFHRLRQENLFTFDMLLTEGLKVIQTTTQDRWPWNFLFVDEYQDSGTLDDNIYEAMPSQNRFYIGDASQSIYKFRGGRMENILTMAARADVEVHCLTENFRSDAAICLAAETLMRNTQLPPVIRSQSQKPGSVIVRHYESPGDELHAICSEAKKAFENGQETAILVRTNPLLDEWVKQLKSMSVPVNQRQSDRRPQDWRRVMDYLTLLCHPNNDWAAYRVMCYSRGKETADKMRLAALKKFSTINQLSDQFPEGMSAQRSLNCLRGMTVSAESMALIELAADELDADATTADLALACMRSEVNSDVGRGITVKTIHSAKGLEFDVVFLPVFEEETIPGVREDKDVDEERRLTYVGITRARHQLVISSSRVRQTKWEKEMNPRNPSRFIVEAGLKPFC